MRGPTLGPALGERSTGRSTRRTLGPALGDASDRSSVGSWVRHQGDALGPALEKHSVRCSVWLGPLGAERTTAWELLGLIFGDTLGTVRGDALGTDAGLTLGETGTGCSAEQRAARSSLGGTSDGAQLGSWVH
jgi:hypothetical protein